MQSQETLRFLFSGVKAEGFGPNTYGFSHQTVLPLAAFSFGNPFIYILRECLDAPGAKSSVSVQFAWEGWRIRAKPHRVGIRAAGSEFFATKSFQKPTATPQKPPGSLDLTPLYQLRAILTIVDS